MVEEAGVAVETLPSLGSRRALTGRPLFDTRQDMALYLRREDTERRLATALRRGLNVLLDGERGSGKTTLLHALRYDARSSNAAAVPANRPEPSTRSTMPATTMPATTMPAPTMPATTMPATTMPGPTRFVYLGAGAAPSAAAVLARLLGDLRGDPAPGWATGGDAATSLARLQAFCADPPADAEPPQGTCVLVDDIDPVIGHQLFGVLRDDLWRLPLQWVVTVESRLAPRLLAPPADAFFDVRLTLPPLTRGEALDLIGRRLGRDLSDVPVTRLPTTPRRLVRLAATAPPEEWSAGEAQLDARLDAAGAIGRSAAEVVQALADLGPLSPSDERLLARLGCTRARASQVLRALYEHGLVTYRDVPADRPGRPNRVYELTPARAVPA